MITRRLAATCALALAFACGGDHATTPTPVPQTTRIIALSGNLAFGTIEVGQTATTTLTVSNTGNGALSVSNVTVPTDGAFVLSWRNGTIPAGGSQPMTVSFSPKAARGYEGVLTVVGDQTGGVSAINLSGTGKVGDVPPFSLRVTCWTVKAGTYVPLACYAVVDTTGSGSAGLRVTADLRPFGLSASWGLVDPGPTGDYGFDLDLHVPADQAAGPVPITFTASNSLGQTATAIGTITVTR